MKKFLAIILTAVMLISALPMTAYAEDNPPSPAVTAPLEKGALAETGAEADLADIACLDKDLPHGDTIWADITALEQDRLSENAQPEDYAVLHDEVEAIVTASDEYVDGSLVYAGDTLYWDTPDGMAHGWSPALRAEANGRSDSDEVESVETLSVDDGDDSAFADEKFDLSASDMVIPQSDANDVDLSPTGADSDLAETGVTTTAKNIALFAPYYNYSGDVWPEETDLLSNLVNTTGGTSTTYNNDSATIDALADALESCAVVIAYTHGNVDRHGAMFDTRMSNTSYLTLTNGSGIGSQDTVWLTGTHGSYRHAFDGGTSTQADGNHVYYVDGTAIANHMDQQAPNNLLWMHSCLTMATDGLCKPLRDKGVGVVFGYSKPATAYGGTVYTNFFFESLMTGATVSAAARYMKEQAGCDWDPIFRGMDYTNAISTGVAFPVFAADNTSYPGQNNVDDTQTVLSQWCLPFKNATSFLKRRVLHVNQLQRIDCVFPFTPSFTAVKQLSGSLPAGMKLYWGTSELYVRGIPTAAGAYTATYQLTSGGTNYTLQFDIGVVKNQTIDKTYDYSFTSGNSFSADINPGSDYFSCTKISGEIPQHMTAKMIADGLHIEANTSIIAGEYTALYEIVTRGGELYRCTVNVTVNPKSTYAVEETTVTMAKGLKGIVKLSDTYFYRIEIWSGSLPDGVRPTYSYDQGFCIFGTPTAVGTYTVNMKRYAWGGYVYPMKLTVNVNEPSATDCTVNLHNIYGDIYSIVTKKGSSSYTLPQYGQDLPVGVRFTNWWIDGKTYKAGDTITVNALTVDVYALCADIEPITSVAVTGVVEPVAGKTPTYAASVPSGGGYTVEDFNDSNCWKNGVCWYNASGREMSFTDTFVAGRKYTAQVSLVPVSSEYAFAASVTGRLNGHAATVGSFNASTAAQNIYVQYTFTCPEQVPITSVAVTGVVEPVAGKTPTYAASVPSGNGYAVDDYSDDNCWKNGVCWYDWSGTEMSFSDTFVAGQQYIAQISLVTASDAYAFDAAADGTINGCPATVGRFSPSTATQNLYVQYYFICADPYIRSLEISGVIAPVAGAKPSYNAVIPSGAGYELHDVTGTTTVNGVSWSYVTGRTTTYLNSQTAVFEEGKTYTFRAWIRRTSDEHPLATSGLTATVNGKNATISYGREGVSGVSCYVTCTFTCQKASGILGDVDGDGSVTIIDATMIQRHLASMPTLAYNEAAADTDGDGSVTIVDATYIQRWLANLSSDDKIGKAI